jgi:tRNA(Ile)-lysidine synthase
MSAVATFTWLSRVEGFLRRWTSPQDRLLAAVSGGADSVAMLAALSDELGLRSRLIVGHIDHGIRPDAPEDAAVVRGLCGERGLACDVRKVNAPELARRECLSIEAACRRLRYEALEGMAVEHGCRWILTGHTRDDSAETVLLRMLGGAPWYEWTAIPSRRGRVLRPLIEVMRPDLRQWVHSRGLPYREDPTNTDPRHLRNRLRMVLFRKQGFWSEERVERLAQAGQLLWWGMEAYRAAARRMAVEAGRGSGVFGLEIERILGYFSSLTFVPVEVAWAQGVGRPEARLPSAIRRQIPAFLRGKSPQASLELGEGMIAHRRGGRVWLYRDSRPEISLRVGLGDHHVSERAALLTLGFDVPQDVSYKAAIDPQCLERELHLRSWRPGDRLKISGRPTKKVADLLAERKLNPFERARVLVLADESGPLLMIGGPVAQRALPPECDSAPLWLSWKTSDGT